MLDFGDLPEPKIVDVDQVKLVQVPRTYAAPAVSQQEPALMADAPPAPVIALHRSTLSAVDGPDLRPTLDRLRHLEQASVDPRRFAGQRLWERTVQAEADAGRWVEHVENECRIARTLSEQTYRDVREELRGARSAHMKYASLLHHLQLPNSDHHYAVAQRQWEAVYGRGQDIEIAIGMAQDQLTELVREWSHGPGREWLANEPNMRTEVALWADLSAQQVLHRKERSVPHLDSRPLGPEPMREPERGVHFELLGRLQVLELPIELQTPAFEIEREVEIERSWAMGY